MVRNDNFMNIKMEVLSKVVDVQVPMAFLGAKLLALDWLPRTS